MFFIIVWKDAFIHEESLLHLYRADSEHSKEVVKRYDWTYTTDYRGTLLGEHMQIKVFCALTLKLAECGVSLTQRAREQVTPTTERIDMERLKAREQIKFFEDVLLFEDELHDHGVSMINVKIVSFIGFLYKFTALMVGFVR